MIAKINRFHGHGSLRYLYKNGQTHRSRLFNLKVIKNTRRKNSRFVVVVSKKVSKKAVVRNRIRRRIYEYIQNQTENLNDIYDIAIIVTSVDVAEMDFLELTSQLQHLLVEAKTIPNNLKG
jgi:ribonuclease P protein component